MPIIAPMRETASMQAGNPIPISSSDDARIAGESISKAGSGLMNLASSVSSVLEEADRLNRQNAVKAFGEWSRTQSMKDYANALASDTSPDGSGMVPAFEKAYEAAVKEKAKEIGDPTTRAAAMNAAMDHKNDRLAQMIPESMKRRLDYGYKTAEQIVNDKAAWIQAHPDSFDRELADTDTHFALQKDQLGPNYEKIGQVARNTYARAALRGLQQQGKYEEARNSLAEKFGQYLNADKDEVINAAAEINNAEWQSVTRKHAEDERQRHDAEKKLKDIKEQNGRRLYGMFSKAKTPVEREAAANTADALFAAGMLEKDDYNFLSTNVGKRVEVKDDFRRVQYLERVMSGESLDNIKNDVMAANAAGKYSSDNAEKTLNLIRQTKDKQKNDPEHTLRLQTAKKRLDYTFGSEGLVNIFPENWQKQKQVVLQEWTDLVTLKGMDPGVAADTVINKYKPKSDNAPFVPGATYNENFSTKGLEAAAKRFEEQYSKGMMSSDELRRRGEILKFRKKILQEEGRK